MTELFSQPKFSIHKVQIERSYLQVIFNEIDPLFLQLNQIRQMIVIDFNISIVTLSCKNYINQIAIQLSKLGLNGKKIMS